MSHPARGPARRAGIDGKANGAGRRRAVMRVPVTVRGGGGTRDAKVEAAP